MQQKRDRKGDREAKKRMTLQLKRYGMQLSRGKEYLGKDREERKSKQPASQDTLYLSNSLALGGHGLPQPPLLPSHVWPVKEPLPCVPGWDASRIGVASKVRGSRIADPVDLCARLDTHEENMLKKVEGERLQGRLPDQGIWMRLAWSRPSRNMSPLCQDQCRYIRAYPVSARHNRRYI